MYTFYIYNEYLHLLFNNSNHFRLVNDNLNQRQTADANAKANLILRLISVFVFFNHQLDICYVYKKNVFRILPAVIKRHQWVYILNFNYIRFSLKWPKQHTRTHSADVLPLPLQKENGSIIITLHQIMFLMNKIHRGVQLSLLIRHVLVSGCQSKADSLI